MADLAKLIVSLEAQTAKYERGLEKANKRLARFERFQKRKLDGVTRKFRQFAGGIAAVLGTRALINFGRQTLRLIDAQAKFAQRLGITQAALAGLALAAEQTGITQQQLSLGLQRFTRRTAEAAAGTGEAKNALQELGLSAKELSRLSPDEAFVRLSGAFSQVTNQSDKVRLAFKLFDSEGVGLLNTLALGEDQLRAFIKQASELGVALGQTQTKNVEDANDALNILGKTFQGLGNTIIAGLAPYLISAAENLQSLVAQVTQAIPLFTAWAESILGVQREVERLTLAELELEFAVLTDKARDLKDQIEDLSDQRDPFDLGEGTGGNSLLTVREQELKAIEDRLDAIIAKRKEIAAGGPDTGPAPEVPGVPGQVFKTGAKIESRAGRSRAAFERSDIGREFAENERRFAELARIVEETNTPLEAFQAKLREIAQTAENNPLIDDELVKRQTENAVEAYQDALDRLSDKTEDASDFIKETWKQAARNMQDAFAEFFFDPFDDGLKGMLNGIIDTLRRAAAELLASELFKYLASLGGGGGFFGFLGGLLGRATGGPVLPNTPYMVGERGPELFVPNAAGRIVPGGAMGGPVVNITTKVDAGVDPGRLLPILDENNKRVKAEFLDALDRGVYR